MLRVPLGPSSLSSAALPPKRLASLPSICKTLYVVSPTAAGPIQSQNTTAAVGHYLHKSTLLPFPDNISLGPSFFQLRLLSTFLSSTLV